MSSIPVGWTPLVIGDCVKFEGGSQPPRSTFVHTPKEGYIRLIQIRDYKTDKFATYIPKHLAQRFCTRDDIMIGRYGPPIFQILRGLEGAYNVALIKAVPDESLMCRDYLYYFLQQEALFELMEHLSQRSSGQTGVEMDALREYPAPLPPLSEQRKIAAILSAWDDAITLTERLIAALRHRKQALMQLLLTGKVRFKQFEGEVWEEVEIGQVAVQVSERNVGGMAYPVLSCTKYEGLVDSLEYFGKQIFSEDLSTYKLVRRGQFAYATNHIEEGSIGYQDLCETAVISPMYTVFEASEQVNDQFLYRVLKTELYRQIFAMRTSASVDRRGSLRWNEFSRIRIPLPSLEEQAAITEVFAANDAALVGHETLREQLQTQKRGLMQQLLTGVIRVRVEE